MEKKKKKKVDRVKPEGPVSGAEVPRDVHRRRMLDELAKDMRKLNLTRQR